MSQTDAFNARKNDSLETANSFHLYNTHNASRDANFITGCNQTMDTLLVFAGLFSAIVTAFIVQNQQLLASIGQDRTNDILVVIALQLNRTAIVPLPQPSPTGSTTANVIFFASLSVTLIAALAAMLVKQWVQAYGVESLVGRCAQEIARSRARSWRGVERYRIHAFIAVVPMLLHIGLAVFFVGLLVWSYEGIDRKTFYTILVVMALGFLAYTGLGVTPCVDQTAPFRWPFSTILQWILDNTVRPRKWIQGIYRNLLHLPVVDSSVPMSNATRQITVRTDKLIAYEPQLDRDIEDLPSEPLEMEIFREVVEKSLSIGDTCIAIEDIRCMMLRESFDPLHTFPTDDTVSLPVPFQRVILQKCTSIAASSFTSGGKKIALLPHSIDRARSVCMFLETYLQTHFGQNNCHDILNTRPVRDFAEALFGYTADPNTELGDISLMISVRALLKHKVFGYDGSRGCPDCFISDSRPLKQFFRRSAEELSRSAVYNLQRARFIRRCIRILLITLTDCLLHHNGVNQMLKTDLRETISRELGSIETLSDELEALKTYIEEAKSKVPASDSETIKWLDAILVPWTKKTTRK